MFGRVVLIAAVLLGLSACGDDAPKLQSSDKPEDIVAYAIDSIGPSKAVLPATQSRQLVIASMSSQGIPATEANCVLAVGLPLVGGDAGFAKLTIHDVARFADTAKHDATTEAQKAALAACVSADSTARGKAKQLSPDFDPALARDLGAAGAELDAKAVGLTGAQAKCFADDAFRRVPLDTVRAIVAGTAKANARDTGAVVLKCLPTARMNTLAVRMEKVLLQQKADRAAEQQKLQDEINRAVQSGTTIPGITLPPGLLPTTTTTVP